MLTIGNLNKKLSLFQPDMISDGQGGQMKNPATDGWTYVTSIWGEFVKTQVKNVANAQGTIVSFAETTFKIHRRTDIQSGWNVKCMGRTYRVDHTYDPDYVTTVLVCRDAERIG